VSSIAKQKNTNIVVGPAPKGAIFVPDVGWITKEEFQREVDAGRQALTQIRNELATEWINRQHEILLLQLSAISGIHLLMLGHPGSGKTGLTKAWTSRIIGADFFYRSFSDTMPEESLYGPPSLKAYQNEEYARITNGMLPSAHIALLDEVFKGHRGLWDTLLEVLQERKFEDKEIPLLAAYFASNEYVTDVPALIDRFGFKITVKDLDDEKMVDYFRMKAEKSTLRSRQFASNFEYTDLKEHSGFTTVTLRQLYILRFLIDQDLIGVNPSVITLLSNIISDLSSKGIRFSARRVTDYVYRAAKAHSLLTRNGVTKLSDFDVKAQDLLVLTYMAWSHPDQEQLVKDIIKKKVGTRAEMIKNNLKELQDIRTKVAGQVGEIQNSANKATFKAKQLGQAKSTIISAFSNSTYNTHITEYMAKKEKLDGAASTRLLFSTIEATHAECLQNQSDEEAYLLVQMIEVWREINDLFASGTGIS
jgi:MoxR-like ATPase